MDNQRYLKIFINYFKFSFLNYLGLVLYPNHPECLLLRSSLYRKLGKYAEALKDLDDASKNMTIDDNTEQVLKQISITYNELSLYLIQKKNYPDAMKLLDEALKFGKDDINIHLNKHDLFLI